MIRPLTKVLIIYILGLMTGYFGLLPPILLTAIGLSALVLGILCIMQDRQNPGVYFYLLTLVLGALIIQWHAEFGRGNVAGLAGCPVTISGTVCEEPDVRINYINYVVNIEKVEAIEQSARGIPHSPAGKLLLTVSGEGQSYAYGDRLRVTTTPVLPKEPGQPGEFNYRKYLQMQGIQLTAKSWQGAGVRKTGTGKVNFFVDACLLLKRKLVSVTRATLAPQYVGLLQGVLFGSGGLIDNQTRNDFAMAGVVHILSVSGYHVALLVAICLFFVNMLGINRKAGTVFTVVVTLAYTVMSGAGPPAVRSLIMGWALLLAQNLKRNYDWVNSLSLAGLVILLINPYYFANAGFQLSFAATWGVLYLTPQINKMGRFFFTPAGNNEVVLPKIPLHLMKKRGILRLIGNSAGITLSAQIAVLPIAAYYFNYFSLIAVLANLIIVPLTTLVMLLGGLASFAGLIWLPLAGVINVSTGIITELILRMAHWLAGLPLAVVIIKQPAVYEILGFYLFLFVFVETLKNPAISLKIKRMVGINYPRLVLIGLAAAACLLWINIASPGTKELELTFLDVGQGDAAVFESPGGFTAVIDTGGTQGTTKSSYNPGEKILMPFLRRKGISRIDVLLLSHAHADHIQGAGFLANNIPVKMLIIDRQFYADAQGTRLVNDFKAKGTKIREVSGGDLIWFDEKTKLEVLSPPDNVTTDANNDSLIFRLGCGEFHVLFTGDAGAEALANLDKAKLHAEIVKVPHHGSKNSWSESFYRAVNPDLAIISVGTNYFGHPSGQVLRGLQKLGAACYRTDRCGAVTIDSAGSGFKVRTGKKWRIAAD